LKNNDVINEGKLLHKYGGLRWHDVENDMMFIADTGDMILHAGRSGCGWCVKGASERGRRH
jgi:hypothetical protein